MLRILRGSPSAPPAGLRRSGHYSGRTHRASCALGSLRRLPNRSLSYPMPSVRLNFDGLTFDLDTRQIWVGGSEVRLSPKAFDLLALLIERRPRAVSKDDISRHLWPGTFVSESSLPSLVSE